MWPTSSLPSVADICSAPWSTLPYIPSAIREDWSRLFTSAMRQFLQTPNASTLSLVYLTSKALLAQPTRGGRTRREALLRTFRDRILLWERGEIDTLWEQLKLQNRRLSEKPHLFKSEVKELNRVAHLVDAGYLSKAARQLLSHGIHERTPETLEKVRQLFPQPANPHPLRGPITASSLSITPDQLLKVIDKTPQGLAPGPSGLRAEHLQALLPAKSKRRPTDPTNPALQALTDFVNYGLAGLFPSEIQGPLCAGLLVPLKKKDGGIRPVVVGDTLRNLVSRAGMHFADTSQLANLFPTQLCLARGPALQGGIYLARQWACRMAETR